MGNEITDNLSIALLSNLSAAAAIEAWHGSVDDGTTQFENSITQTKHFNVDRSTHLYTNIRCYDNTEYYPSPSGTCPDTPIEYS